MMPKFLSTTLPLAATLILAGCGAGLYDSGNWQAPPGDAVTADWDVASAKCEGEAVNKEASAEEKRAAMEIAASTGATLSDIRRHDLGPEADAVVLGLAVAIGIIAGLMPSQMDEAAKDNHFIHCMRSLGWVNDGISRQEIHLEGADQRYFHFATQRALDSGTGGKTEKWENPISGNRGIVHAGPVFHYSSGQFCRNFDLTVVIGGETHEASGMACRQEDGSWVVPG